MDMKEIISALDTEIARLQEAKRLLGGQESHGIGTAMNGRRGPRHMSAEARARIAAAQRKRWAKVKAKQK